MKNIYKYFLIIILIFGSATLYGQGAFKKHRLSISAGLLMRNALVSQISTFSTNENFYAANISTWGLDNFAVGIFAEGAYEYSFTKNFFIKVSTGFETTGHLNWNIDLGGGVRIPIKDGISFSISSYFAISQTFGDMFIVPGITGVVGNNPVETIGYYVGFFGIKTKFALEIPLQNKYVISPYISYTAYPYSAHNIVNELDTDLYINGVAQGLRLDGIQVGVEFSFLL